MSLTIWFWLSVFVLFGMLFLPVSHLIWIISVRFQQRKLGRELVGNELSGQKRRARFVAMFICLVFSFLFCLDMIGLPK